MRFTWGRPCGPGPQGRPVRSASLTRARGDARASLPHPLSPEDGQTSRHGCAGATDHNLSLWDEASQLRQLQLELHCPAVGSVSGGWFGSRGRAGRILSPLECKKQARARDNRSGDLPDRLAIHLQGHLPSGRAGERRIAAAPLLLRPAGPDRGPEVDLRSSRLERRKVVVPAQQPGGRTENLSAGRTLPRQPAARRPCRSRRPGRLWPSR